MMRQSIDKKGSKIKERTAALEQEPPLKDVKIMNRLAHIAVDKAVRYTDKLKAKKELDKKNKPEVDIKVRKNLDSRKNSYES